MQEKKKEPFLYQENCNNCVFAAMPSERCRYCLEEKPLPFGDGYYLKGKYFILDENSQTH